LLKNYEVVFFIYDNIIRVVVPTPKLYIHVVIQHSTQHVYVVNRFGYVVNEFGYMVNEFGYMVNRFDTGLDTW